MKIRLTVLAVLMLVLAPLSAQAGWVMTERVDSYSWSRSKGRYRSSSSEQKSYMVKGRVRSNEGGEGTGTDESWTVFDLDRGRILMVNSKRRIYYEGPLKEWLDTMKKVSEAMKKMAEGMKDMPGMKGLSTKPVIKKLGNGGRIAGYPTFKYRVSVGGSIDSVVWIAPNAKLPGEIRKMDERMTELMRSTGLEIKELELQAMGMEMKTEHYFSGKGKPDQVTTVVSMKKQKIPASVFEAPKGYRRAASIEEFSNAGEERSGPGAGFTPPSVPMMGGRDAGSVEGGRGMNRGAVPDDSREESGWGRRRSYDEEQDEGSNSMGDVGEKAKEIMKGLGGLFGK
ncbi:MAG: DUF4412 domain-containing protein [Thermodesulfobacteriota bacterium]